MKKFNFLIVLISTAFILFSVSCTKNIQNKNNSEMIINDQNYEVMYNVSTQTKLFLADFKLELQESVKNIEEFIPSDKLIETYNIRKQEKNYFISGFIKINDGFKIEDLENINVLHGLASNDIKTVQIPIITLSKFLKIDGIDYFEISVKTKLKNSK